MNSSQLSQFPSQDQTIKALRPTLDQRKINISSKINQNMKGLWKRMHLILIVSFIILILVYFYSFRKLSIPLLPIVLRQQYPTTTTLEPQFASNVREHYVLSKSKYFNQIHKPTENVIVYLVASFSGDERLAYNPYPRLRVKIIQLDRSLADNATTDLIIFHTGYPFRRDFMPIMDATKRHVDFVNIDHIFYKFSPGFDPHMRDPTWTQKGKWNYHHMCYFWFKQVFQLNIIQRYRYLMRLDDDSQTIGKWSNVFDMMIQRKALYLANKRQVDYEYVLPGMTLVRNLTMAFIKKYNITPQNPVMFSDLFNRTLEIPNYWNNFEVVDLSLIRRKEVISFIDFVDESRGIFLYRWGDAPLRYITLALFVKANEILHRVELGLDYCHPC